MTVFAWIWMVAFSPQPTTVVAAMSCPAAKLMFEVPGHGPLGQAVAKPAACGLVIVRLTNTAVAVVGTPLALKVVSIVRAVFPARGAFGLAPVGASPGRES